MDAVVNVICGAQEILHNLPNSRPLQEDWLDPVDVYVGAMYISTYHTGAIMYLSILAPEWVGSRVSAPELKGALINY